MAKPFAQPEDDESVRHHGNGASHSAAAGGGAGGGSGSTSNNTVAPTGNSNVPAAAAAGASASAPLPIPGSPLLVAAPSGTTTAVQTPLIGPMNGDQLVQLFYEALYRYSRGDTPSTPISQSPQSTSCSPFTTGYYNGQVFFPQTPNGVQRPPVGGRGTFFGLPTPSPSGSSSHSSQNSANSPDTPSCSSAAPYHQFPSSFPVASSSTASAFWNHELDDSSESDASQPSSSEAGCSPHCVGSPNHSHHHQHHHHPHQQQQQQPHNHLHHSHQLQLLDASSSITGPTMGLMPGSGFIPPHLDYMANREQLQEFPGKIPQRKKKSKANKSKKSRFLEQTLVWPTLAVTATLIALGCGLLAAR